jgi:hypothetical protein
MKAKLSMTRRRPLLSFLATAALTFPTMLTLVGCDWMTDYPHNEEQTDRSDMLKTGSGTYGGTNSAYDTTNPVGHTTGPTTSGSNPMNTVTSPTTSGTTERQ